jgi:hypothetical protein
MSGSYRVQAGGFPSGTKTLLNRILFLRTVTLLQSLLQMEFATLRQVYFSDLDLNFLILALISSPPPPQF